MRAYLNRCVHLPLELDTEEGRFFDVDKEHLVCGRHGALFMPDTGRCALGASAGKVLYAIAVMEQEGRVYWQPNDYFRPVVARLIILITGIINFPYERKHRKQTGIKAAL